MKAYEIKRGSLLQRCDHSSCPRKRKQLCRSFVTDWNHKPEFKNANQTVLQFFSILHFAHTPSWNASEIRSHLTHHWDNRLWGEREGRKNWKISTFSPSANLHLSKTSLTVTAGKVLAFKGLNKAASASQTRSNVTGISAYLLQKTKNPALGRLPASNAVFVLNTCT